MLLHYLGKLNIQFSADIQQIWKQMQTNCILSVGLPIFTARAYARAVLGVVILSVRLSVTRVHCDKTK